MKLSFNYPYYVTRKQSAEALKFWGAHLEQGPDNDP